MAEFREEITLTAIVSGRVQGVGFRQFVWSQARHLPLVGWVRNLPDGSVEVVAQGPRPAIETLRLKLLQGPRYAYVADVSEDWASRTGLPDRFEIR
jgi:acylphosphatase